MRALTERLPTRPDTLLVLLPGAEMVLEDFERYGFIAALRTQAVPVDIVCAGLSYEHVMARTVIETLHTEVILPAKAAGYRAIWLAGISLGAFNALMYASEHAMDITGICLMAPYPGTGDILAEIRQHGGPLAWADTPAALQGDERVLWRWLVHEARHGEWTTPVYCANAREDRFLRGQQMLADLLPTNRVRLLPGAHNWPAWQAQWADWLSYGPLAVDPCPTGVYGQAG